MASSRRGTGPTTVYLGAQKTIIPVFGGFLATPHVHPWVVHLRPPAQYHPNPVPNLRSGDLAGSRDRAMVTDRSEQRIAHWSIAGASSRNRSLLLRRQQRDTLQTQSIKSSSYILTPWWRTLQPDIERGFTASDNGKRCDSPRLEQPPVTARGPESFPQLAASLAGLCLSCPPPPEPDSQTMSRVKLRSPNGPPK